MQQRDRALVRPVQIIDEDGERRSGGRTLDKLANRLEHARAFQAGIAERDEWRQPEPIEQPRQIGQAGHQ